MESQEKESEDGSTRFSKRFHVDVLVCHSYETKEVEAFGVGRRSFQKGRTSRSPVFYVSFIEFDRIEEDLAFVIDRVSPSVRVRLPFDGHVSSFVSEEDERKKHGSFPNRKRNEIKKSNVRLRFIETRRSRALLLHFPCLSIYSSSFFPSILAITGVKATVGGNRMGDVALCAAYAMATVPAFSARSSRSR